MKKRGTEIEPGGAEKGLGLYAAAFLKIGSMAAVPGMTILAIEARKLRLKVEDPAKYSEQGPLFSRQEMVLRWGVEAARVAGVLLTAGDKSFWPVLGLYAAAGVAATVGMFKKFREYDAG